MKKNGRTKKAALEAAALCAALGVFLTGCGIGEDLNDTKSAGTKNGDTNIQIEAPGKITAEALAEYPTEPVFQEDGEQWDYARAKREMITEEFAAAYGDFAVKTSVELLKGSSENMAYSPLSLYYALALACDGAEGETQEEMLKLLGYEDARELAADCKSSFEGLYYVPNEENNKPNEWGEYSAESRYSLMIANSLWADDALTLKDEFAERAAANFYADVFKGDLQSAETAKMKSEWVSERTHGLITPSEQPANDQTVLSIINTIYFYDEWITRFDKERTEPYLFTCEDGTKVTCDFMNMIQSSSGFRRGENFTASTLSLKNGSMVFVLPDEGVDVHELVNDAETLAAAIGDGGDSLFGKVTWKVPKFSYGSDMELADMLKTLGMEQAFAESADFSGIADDSPLFISNVKQNAHIGIDENGVEGAAFTEIMYAGAALPKDEAEMILDRPFLYVVKNNGQIVFMGICENPSNGNVDESRRITFVCEENTED
ncbi:MAG: serpin family protein [Lachnospiraceae bacterium]|nr:serpin family protein [Lachnospiraceae bacterium]